MIYTGPTTASAEGQIEIINSLIAQNVNAIAISANDADALVRPSRRPWNAHHRHLLGTRALLPKAAR